MLTPPAEQKVDSLFKHEAPARPESRSRRSGAASKGWRWSSAPEGGFRATLQVTSGVAVIAVEGQLNRDAIQVCRQALEVALRLRTAQVVLDLQRARIDEESRVVLALMGRMSQRRGVSLWLAGLTVPARGVLRAKGAAAYRVFPTVSAALIEAAMVRPRRH
jgi:hypothetical protein